MYIIFNFTLLHFYTFAQKCIISDYLYIIYEYDSSNHHNIRRFHNIMLCNYVFLHKTGYLGNQGQNNAYYADTLRKQYKCIYICNIVNMFNRIIRTNLISSASKYRYLSNNQCKCQSEKIDLIHKMMVPTYLLSCGIGGYIIGDFLFRIIV